MERIQLNYAQNPYVMHEQGERALDTELEGVYHRIAALILGRASCIPVQITRPRAFGRNAEERAVGIYGALQEESNAMRTYFQLMQDAAALSRWVQIHPENAALWRRELRLRCEVAPAAPTTTAPVDTVVEETRTMARDWRVLTARRALPGGVNDPGAQRPLRGDRPFDGSNGRDPGAGRNPENGFMGLREEVVRHLVAAGLEWGGASWEQSNGDLMHFQLPASDPARQAVHRAGEAARRTAAAAPGQPAPTGASTPGATPTPPTPMPSGSPAR